MKKKKVKFEICQLCKKPIEIPAYGDGLYDYSDAWDYRGFVFHEKCFEEGCKKVDERRDDVITETEHSLNSQRGGEWINGGYKTMKTDPHTGKPLLKKVNEPAKLKNYEKGIL